MQDVVRDMQQPGKVFRPNGHLKSYHDCKYKVFRKLCNDQREYRAIMKKDDGTQKV